MLPASMAIGNIHSGTIAGKLKGVIPRDAERLAQRVRVDPGADALGGLALEQMPDPARELDDLEAAPDLAARVVERLSVLGGDEPRDVVPRRVARSSRKAKSTAVRRGSDCAAQPGCAAVAAPTARSTSAADA